MRIKILIIKLTYEQVKRDVAKFYDKDMIHQYSSAVDIVAII